MWHEPNGGLHLTATNSTANIRPVYVRAGDCRSRRVVGVLFEHARGVTADKSGDEWACLPSVPPSLLKDLMGIRVVGTSLEPIARDGQIVLAKKTSAGSPPAAGTLACVDIREVGAVIKRCYADSDEWVLSPVNMVDVEKPMRVDPEEILHVYEVVGVIYRMTTVESKTETEEPPEPGMRRKTKKR